MSVNADRREEGESPESNRRTRLAATAVGGTLAALGLRRRSLTGAAMALGGGWLAYRGMRAGASAPGSEAVEPSEAVEVEDSITVGASADELYEVWRDPEQFARVMGHFAEVSPSDGDRQRWVVRGPLPRSVSWETRIAEDRPGELVRWESVAGAPLPNEGSVRFEPAPADRGTEVTLRVRFDPPGGSLGSAAMSLLGVVPETLASQALGRLKSLVEAGEIPTLEANPSGRGKGDLV